MAEEAMAVTNGTFDPIANYARLSERVENQGKDIIDLRSNMNTGFQNLHRDLTVLTNELRGSTKTQWPVIWSAIGVSFTIIVAIGALAYAPITTSMARLDQSLAALTEKTITRQEVDQRAARSSEDRARQEQAIADLRGASVTRLEWQERNRARDQEVADLSRRVEEIRSDFGAVYGARDVLIDLKNEVDRLRTRVNDRLSAGQLP